MDMSAPVVTLSAAYGAGGSVVGPRVARMLGVQFVDRAIPVAVADRLSVPLDEALEHDGRDERGLGRLIVSFARAPVATGWAPPLPMLDPCMFKDETARVIREVASGGAVILGRAGALVLKDNPAVLRVRLDGPVDARVAQVVRLGGMDEREARRNQRDTDRARDAYVKHFYGADATDARLYHLVIDSTAIDLDACAELIATAARARQRPAAGEPPAASSSAA